MKKGFLARLLFPLMALSISSPLTTLTSCGMSTVNFKFDKSIVYLPINMVEDLKNFMTIDSSILPREILWRSSNTDIVKISTKGEALGVRATGSNESVVLSATVYGNTVSCRAIVGEFSFNTNMIVLRESSNSANVYETFFSSNSTNIKDYTDLSIANTEVAYLDENGNIIPHAEGLTTISATSRGGTVVTTGICVERDILDSFTLVDTSDSTSYIISNYTGTDTEVVLPRFKKGKQIMYLGECFKNNSKVTKVTVPDTYKKIVSSTFINNCDNITELVLPDTIEDVKDYIFYNSTGLNNLVNSSDNIRRGFKYLKATYNQEEGKGKYTYLVGVDFNSIPNDKSLVVDADCRVIAHRCLSAAALGDNLNTFRESVTNFRFPSECELVCIADEVYTGNTAFTELEFPNTVKYIHNSFKNLGQINNFKVPDSIEYIGNNWLDGSTFLDGIRCFTTVGSLVYLGNDRNKYLILYKLDKEKGFAPPDQVGSFEAVLEPSCRIIGANAFAINSSNPNWLQGKTNGLARINKPSNDLDKTNRLFTGTISAGESSIVCVCGNAFKNCRYISNIILSAFVKYFDIEGISSSGIGRIFCESSAQPVGVNVSADTSTASSTLYFLSENDKPGNYWHYDSTMVARAWVDETSSS